MLFLQIYIHFNNYNMQQGSVIFETNSPKITQVIVWGLLRRWAYDERPKAPIFGKWPSRCYIKAAHDAYCHLGDMTAAANETVTGAGMPCLSLRTILEKKYHSYFHAPLEFDFTLYANYIGAIKSKNSDEVGAVHQTSISTDINANFGEDSNSFDLQWNYFDRVAIYVWYALVLVCHRNFWEEKRDSCFHKCVEIGKSILWARDRCLKLLKKKPIQRYAVQPLRNTSNYKSRTDALTTQAAALRGTRAVIGAKQRRGRHQNVTNKNSKRNSILGEIGISQTTYLIEPVPTSATEALFRLHDDLFVYTFGSSLDIVSGKMSEQIDQVCPRAPTIPETPPPPQFWKVWYIMNQ